MKSLLYNESDQRCPQQKLPLWGLTLSCTDKYWLPQGPAQVKQVLAKYLTCIKYQGGPYKTKPLALWPNIKVNESPAFTNTGLDYFGPLYVKNETVRSKAWVCIVTCIAMRAMHLELVKVMTVVQLLGCWRRFTAWRGKPDEIISDNSPQFKMAKNAVDLAWENVAKIPDVISYVSERRINWSFIIIEFSPWTGGFWKTH